MPFEAAFDAGTSQIMPYYGMPVGTEYDEVGFGFNKSVITGLLRERYGFDGVVCTDWGLLSDAVIAGRAVPGPGLGRGTPLHPGAHAKRAQRRRRPVRRRGHPGALGRPGPQRRDQRGADRRVRPAAAAREVRARAVRLPAGRRRAGRAIVGSTEFRAAGEAAQRASFTLLANGTDAAGAPVLPLSRGIKVYLQGVSAEAAAGYGTVVGSPEEADVAIVRLQAPYEQRETMFENFFHAGSLDYPAEQLEGLVALCGMVPTVIDVFLDRPAILTPLVGEAAAITANFGAGSHALLDVLFGVADPRGRLPMDLPRSMDAVQASLPDVPFDTADPLFRFGHGLGFSTGS